jgi:hypothetical protein
LDTTNIKDIFVYIYSYKEPNLLDFVEQLIDNSSKNNRLHFYISDQNNLTRLRQFSKHKNVFYEVIWWDELVSPLHYLKKCIDQNYEKKYDYALLLKQHVEMPKNWDVELVDRLPIDSVISGLGSYNFNIDKNFYIKKNNLKTETMTKTSYIDRNFIFGLFDSIKKIEIPTKIKYYGEEEYISMDLLSRGLDIYSLPSDYYKKVSLPIHERGYIPFSLNHNYNEVLDLLINNKTSKLVYLDPSRFLSATGIDVSGLSLLPFDFNDIEYDRHSPLDNVGGRRYIEKLRSVS